jgi:hypothetical protein
MRSVLSMRHALLSVIVAVLGIAALPAQADDEPESINAFAVWTAEAAVARTADKKAVLSSALTGTLFVETSEGPVDTGHIVCPAMVHIDLESGRQSGNGYCTFTANDGAQAFGEWECTGVHMVGCSGTFKLTGGTERLAGVRGSSKLILRGRFHEIELHASKTISYTVTGIALWRDLKVETK